MTLDEAECWARLAAAERGVLGTLHRRRGVDLVPVVFALDLDRRRIVIPIDTVKAKSGRRLQRLDNLGHDPRCSLVADHYDTDWSALWWVRVHGHGADEQPADEDLGLLGERYPQYRGPGTVIGLIVITTTDITGWSAER